MSLSLTHVPLHHDPWTNLSDIRNKILPEGQSAPNEPHSYDMMGQAHDVLIEPGGRTDRSSGLPLGIRETITGLRGLLSLELSLTLHSKRLGLGPG